jgi:hypothetical protein
VNQPLFHDLQPGDWVTVWRPRKRRKVPPVISMRHALKVPIRDGFEALGERYEFRCIEVREIPPDAAERTDDHIEGTLSE